MRSMSYGTGALAVALSVALTKFVGQYETSWHYVFGVSIVAILPVAALLYVGVVTLGSGALKDLALSLFVGMAAGIYSSVFIASQVLTHWKEREPVYHARAERIRQQFGGEVPAYAVATAGAPIDVAPKESSTGESCSNHHTESWVSTRPLSGIGVGSTTS